MPLPSSSFAKAKLQLTQFTDAYKVGHVVVAGDDLMLTQYRIPKHIQSDDASQQLLYAALSLVTTHCSYGVDHKSGELVVSIPSYYESLPIKSIGESLHELRRMLLNNIRQQPDGSFLIAKSMRFKGMANIELGELVNALVTQEDAPVGEPAQVETLYRAPRNPHQPYAPPQTMKREAFVGYQDRHFKSTGLVVPPGAAEAYVSINGTAAQSVFKSLGIDLGGRPH